MFAGFSGIFGYLIGKDDGRSQTTTSLQNMRWERDMYRDALACAVAMSEGNNEKMVKLREAWIVKYAGAKQ